MAGVEFNTSSSVSHPRFAFSQEEVIKLFIDINVRLTALTVGAGNNTYLNVGIKFLNDNILVLF